MAYPNISPLPTPPNPDAPATFDTLAYPFTQAQVSLVAEINALIAELNDTFFPDTPVRAMLRGTAAAPAYSFDPDSDTGMWSPGANTLAWSTGGTERLRLTSAGLLTSSTAIVESKTDTTSGRLMTVGAGGILGEISISAPDLDTVPYGFFANGALSSPPPVRPDGLTGNSRWAGATIGASSTRLQIAARTDHPTPATNRLYFRVNREAAWQPWRRIYDNLSAVGTVAMSDGYPSSALFEQGSAGSGYWTKFADGTMIVWASYNVSGVTVASGSLFTTAEDLEWTYPVEFASTPRVVHTARHASIICGSSARGTQTNTSATFRPWAAASAGTVVATHVAFGRWN